MGDNEREAGRPEQYSTDRVLSIFTEGTDPCEPRTAREVADELGCARRTALGKLNELADGGALESKKVGGRSRVYWVPGGTSGGGE